MKKILFSSLAFFLSMAPFFAEGASWEKYIPGHNTPSLESIDRWGKNFGHTRLLKVTQKNVTIMGPASIKKSEVGALVVDGLTKIKQSKIGTIIVQGPLKISEGSEVLNTTSVKGPLEAKDTKFGGDLEIHSTVVILKRCYVKGDVIVTSETQAPEVFLHNTVIEGQIRFTQAEGHVYKNPPTIKKGIVG